MRVGMLWLDDDHRAGINERVDRAVAYYRGKYGRKPNLCVVHPSTLGEETYQGSGGVEVRTSISVLPDHLWLGVHEAEGLEIAAAMGLAQGETSSLPQNAQLPIPQTRPVAGADHEQRQ